LEYSDEIMIRLAIYEDDGLTYESLRIKYYEVRLSKITGAVPGTYTYKISNYGSGSNFMDATFKLKMEAETRVD